MRRAVSYYRVSTKAQATEKNVSLEVQHERVLAYCLRHDLELIASYTDVLSGRRDDRRQYQAMLTRLEQREADTVVVMYLDRFGRSDVEIAYQILRLRREYQVQVHCTEENIDEPIHLFLSAWKAGQESSRTGERVRAAALRRVRTGHRWGKIPWGWRRAADGSVELDPQTSGAITRAAALLLDDNLGLRQVAAQLNDAGFRRRHGGYWDAGTLRGMLLRECNLGVVSFAKAGSRSNRNGAKESAQAEALPAILDRETYEAVQTRLIDRRRLPAGNSLRSPFLLTGLLYCGLCGGRMHGTTGQSGSQRTLYQRYQCGTHAQRAACTQNYQNAAKVEAAIIADFADQADPAEAAKRTPAREPAPDTTAERAEIKRELERIDNDFIRAFRLYTDGVLADEAQLARANRDLRERQAALQARLADLDAQERAARLAAERAAALPALIQTFIATHESLTIQQRKGLIGQIVARILVWPDHRIRIDYRD